MPNLAATRLLVSPQALVSCVRVLVTRSTLEMPLLEPRDRYNHSPATPLCTIAWFIEGEGALVLPAGAPVHGDILSAGPAGSQRHRHGRPGRPLGGYADQAHLSGQVREITGHSRGKFLRLLESGDESCWIYRSWL